MSKIPYKLNPFGKSEGGPDIYGPTSGLVFYAPLEENVKELTRGDLSTYGTINFTEENTLKCFRNTTTQYGVIYTENKGKFSDTSSFSISFWMNRKYNNYQGSLFFEIGKIERVGKKALYLKDYGGIRTGIVDGSETAVMGTSYVPYQKWFHCVLVFTKSNKRITGYIDGVYKSYSALDALQTWTLDFERLTIGSNLSYNGNNEQWKNGDICGFRYYDRALTQEEITDLSQEYLPKYEITASDQTFRFTPADDPRTKNISYSTNGTIDLFEIVSGELPNTITFNTSTGKFSGRALTDADHTYNLVVKMSGRNVITKEINVTINTVAVTNLSITSPQTFNYITEKIKYNEIIYSCDDYDYATYEITSGSLPTGFSIYQVNAQVNQRFYTQFSLKSQGNQTSAINQSFVIAIKTTYHPTPVSATINVNLALNQITVNDKEFNFYVDDGALSYQINYGTENPITPVYTLSGTLPTGITFDSSTGTFSYDGTATTPTSGTVQVTVSSSTGCSAPDSAIFTLKLNAGSSPIPTECWLYCPCKDGSTFECENENVTIGQTGTPNFYTAAQEGRDCMEITNINTYSPSTYKNIYFDGCYSGASPIPTLDQSRTVAYWIKIPSNMVFYTGHGVGIFDYGYASQWQDFRNAITCNTTPNPTQVGCGCDNYNGLPPGTLTYGTDENIQLTEIWTDYDWHLITYAYNHDTKEWKGYVDGTLQLTKVFTDSLRTARDQQGPLVIGQGSPSRAGHTKQAGAVSFRLSDFRIWRRALTQAEVTKLYNLG